MSLTFPGESEEYRAGQDHRSVGTLEPVWNLFTREGRPDWEERLSY